MAEPASELATHRWLGERSGRGELLDTDFEAMSLMQLYRASDRLFRRREAIEGHLMTLSEDGRGRSACVATPSGARARRRESLAVSPSVSKANCASSPRGSPSPVPRNADGRTLQVRKATRAEPGQRAIYQALGIDSEPGGVKKMTV
ncbi:hypothetical protein JCM17961_43580 [Endothiovibrio diazotrophicus]